ncbi:uncharacterized protein BDZ99DRAFT_194256 [Mytilinidion resinicola]|uniref:RNI-like protein n=1 Tax=Mytilinidion resinicola TaxID=574789 RepID=A0A6A6Z515_9PEZI|nr:uncharacterized protein BDZ99DRAFT_194256 [Mytilinidion resinicola]KAF2815347.1 hypothetical protein BDZ99DRAFT_194256 [Mytilinidion resinicola]
MLRNLHTSAINFSYGEVDSPDLSNVLTNLHNVRVLELAVSNTKPYEDPWEPTKDIWCTILAAQMINPRTKVSDSPESLANLEELRISFTTADLMDGEKMVEALRRLPILRRLALGYASLVTGFTSRVLGLRHDWDSIATLCAQRLFLDKLLLIEPLRSGKPMARLGRDGGKRFPNLKNAAAEVRVRQHRKFRKLERYVCFRDLE